jgi:hypothetical protein
MSKRFLVGAIIIILVTVSLGTCFIYWERKSADSLRVTIAPKDIHEFAAKLGRTNQPTQSVPVPLPLSQPVRLAIGSLGLANDDQNRQLDDLLTAELTGAQGFNLVERQSLDSILKEMNLSLSGLVRARDAIRVGKLVRADWFLLGTPTTLHGINSIAVRLVDARTGVMLDGGVFTQKTASALAAELAGFVRQSRQAAAEARPRIYLAIGTFEDLSVNNRQAAFPTQLRGYLTDAYQHSKVTLLEREYVDTLQQEMRLDLAGLTEGGGTNAPGQMQSAFWLVDGYYQSYETTGLEVELGLNIEQIFGHTIVFGKKPLTLRGQPGEPIFKKIKEAIDGAMSKNTVVVAPTRFSETRAQMGAGREMMRSVTGADLAPMNFSLVWPTYQYDVDSPEAAMRHRNAEEAIRAFETVLLLEPDNREAKMYLAVCFRGPTINRVDEARNYYREIIENGVEDQWSELAQKALRASFENTSSEEQIRWLEAATEHGTNSSAAEFFRREAEAARTNAVLNSEGPKAQELAAAQILDNITNSWLEIVRVGVATDERACIGDFVKTFGTNQAAAAQRLVELYPKLKAQAPELAPYLLALFVTVQADTNSPVAVEFQRMVEQLAEHPDQVFKPDKFWWHIWPAYEWSCDHKLYGTAARLLEGKISAAALYPKHVWGIKDDDKLGLAYAYLGMQQWEKALKIFETYSNQPVRMGNEGPWGQMFSIVSTSKQAAYCRQKIGLSMARNSREFDLGKPVARLGYLAPFAADVDGLWTCINGQLLHSDFGLKTNLVVNLPDPFAPVTVLCISPTTVWIGTAGAGLIEFDKATHKVRQLTEKDGLMMDFISSLDLTGDTLWIGYGNESGGGLGRLDLPTRRLTSFTLSLTGGSEVLRHPSGNIVLESTDQPTHRQVLAVAGGTAGDAWFATEEHPLRHYRTRDNTWEGINQVRNCTSLASDTEQLLVGQRWNYFSHDKSGPLGVSILNFKDGQWRSLKEAEDLPPGAVTTLTLDGHNLWVGGMGYIALVDPAQDKVLGFAYVQEETVDRIQVGGGYVWVQAHSGWLLYRTLLSNVR